MKLFQWIKELIHGKPAEYKIPPELVSDGTNLVDGANFIFGDELPPMVAKHTPTIPSIKENARYYYDIEDWATLNWYKKSKKKSWEALGFSKQEINNIELKLWADTNV